jgi:trigger factor
VGPPRLERTPHKAGEPVRFSATFEVHERPRDIDLAGLRVVRRVPVIDDDAVQEQLERLREVHARSVPIEPPRPARKGDLARLDYVLRFDDKPDAEPLKREGLEVEVGGKYVLDEVAEALAGMSVGEEKDVRLSFPADHQVGSLAGRSGSVHLKLIDLTLRQLPGLDDDFAREVGEADLVALRAKVRAEMEAEARRVADADVDRALLDAVVERANVSLPPSWLEAQVQERLAAFQRTFGGGRDLEEEMRNLLRREVEHQIRRGIAVAWIARQKELRATPEQVDGKLQEIAAAAEKPLPAVKAEFGQKGRERLEAELIERAVLDALRAAAAIEDGPPAAPPEADGK